ncbi:hypothetical protein AVEN_65190-1 [Araneus ventricosus]|uniref:Uncharacterized protein n=1 Tax=Araneus ventricosus TaxID=182803 RepID=A0A4Y2AG70_ARAVE|nr:hypothetical protein AVEN_65190-1 [Araneus ventricosus]
MSRLQSVGLLWFLNRCHPSPVSVVEISTLEFESIVKTGKIVEEDYNIIPRGSRDSTKCFKSANEEPVNQVSSKYFQPFGSDAGTNMHIYFELYKFETTSVSINCKEILDLSNLILW